MKKRFNLLRPMVALLLALSAGVASAQITNWQSPEPFRGEEKDPSKVKEDDYAIPPMPSRPDWREYYLNAQTRNRYYIAREHLNVGTDGAVRFISRVVSPSGTENISVEGIRCGTGERRLYATLQRNGEWSETRGSRWLPIGGGNRLNSYVFMLYSDYLCSAGVAMEPRRILEVLADSFNARTGTPITGYR